MCGGQRVWNAFILSLWNILYVGNQTEWNCHTGEWHELLISQHNSNILVIYLPSDEDCT